jgi:hypothetical protein
MVPGKGCVQVLQARRLGTVAVRLNIICPCGCGESFSPIGTRNRPRSFFSPACSLRVNRVSGGGEGRRHSDVTRAIISEKASRPRPWLRGSANGMHGRTGPLNPRYVDGSSPERQRAYASAEWRATVRAVRVRDGYVCQNCPSRTNLHLHHVKPWAGHPDLRFDPDNILTLCAACHRAEHAKGGAAKYGAVSA